MHPIPSIYWNSLEKYRVELPRLTYHLTILSSSLSSCFTGFIIFLAHLNGNFTGCCVPHIHKNGAHWDLCHFSDSKSLKPDTEIQTHQYPNATNTKLSIGKTLQRRFITIIFDMSSSWSIFKASYRRNSVKVLFKVVLSRQVVLCNMCSTSSCYKWFVTLKTVTERKYLSKANKTYSMSLPKKYMCLLVCCLYINNSTI